MKYIKHILLGFLAITVFVSCGKDDDNQSNNSAPVASASTPTPEIWGATGIQLQRGTDQTLMQFDCNHAEIDQAITLDDTGHFDVPGFFFFDDGRANNKVAARFTGSIANSAMHLNVNASGFVHSFDLAQGVQGTVNTASCSAPAPTPVPPPPPSHTAKPGEWGGDHIDMIVSNSGATYQLDCGHGTIDQKISPNSSGHFHNTGTFTPEGGPTPNPPPAPQPAAYDGTITNNDMTLTIITAINGTPHSANYTLRFGQVGRLVRCL